MKRYVLLVLFLFNSVFLMATHNRAGEITYLQLSQYTFRVTVTTYTYTLSAADRNELPIFWGDNSSSTIYRVSKTELPNYYRKNVYVAEHTYPGPGIYKVLVQDPNRNLGVENIPNSVNVVFSVSTILTVSSNVGLNSTPVLYNPPYDKAAVGYVFIHNPGAYDSDGDSLSYALTSCTRDNGIAIEGYTLPEASDSIGINSVTGDLVWSTPTAAGKYNVAVEISEWRNGLKTGSVVRDMQIDVYNTDNKPPVIDDIEDMCVEAGQEIALTFSASDPDGDSVAVSAASGVFSIDECAPSFTEKGAFANVSAPFNWTPCYETVREQPYSITIKADDNNPEVNLVDLKTFKIKVLGPAPVLKNVYPEGKSIRLVWDNYGTDAIAGFNIYRKEGVSEFNPDSCTSGVPSSTGFVKVGYVEGSSAVTYLDHGNDDLKFGTEYAYRIVAVYPNATESKSSEELKTSLISGIPVITNVSVRNTDMTKGSMFVAWTKPVVDTIPNATGPYEYKIYRADGVDGDNYSLVKSYPTADLNDTVYIDTLINTADNGYVYKIELWNKAENNEFILGEPGYASSLFLEGAPGDKKVRLNFSKNVPWINFRYDIFRFNESTSSFDSIGSTNQISYIDAGLVNGTEYQYYVKSSGAYSMEGMPDNIVNLSEKISVVPVDNEPPCVPSVSVSSDCDNLFNLVSWSVVSGTNCDDNVAGFKIYYKGLNDENLNFLAKIDSPTTTSYKHEITDGVLSGCYAVSAFDDVGNESGKSTMVCIDSCNYYEIPNVFTPNGDGLNDHLVAKASGLVEKVDFKLFGRTGVLIFSTEEPKLNWDGTYKGNIVSSGVYFYQCDVYERRVSGLEQFHLSGFIHVFAEKGATVGNIEY